MEITTRELWTMIHGMGFGGLYLLACSGALVELFRRYSPNISEPGSETDARFLALYLAAMATLAWLAVLTGAYIVYPWYRADAPAGTASLAAFPQRLLLSSHATSGWHTIGMEWKEHVAWLAPISSTMAAAVCIRYGRGIRHHPRLRTALVCFLLISFLAAGLAGLFGAMLNKNAPVEGGSSIHLVPEAHP